MLQRFRFLVVCAPMLALASGGTGQQPTFHAGADAVRVDVLVTGHSGAVRGLAALDFELRDSGVPQRVDIVSYEQVPLHLVLALDVSASVQGSRLARLVDACGATLDGLKAGDQVTLVTFNHGLSRRVGPTGDRAMVRQSLQQLAGSGATSLRDATYAAVIAAGREGRSVAVIFSDGDDTSSWLDEDEVMDTVRKSEVLVYGITAGRLSSTFLRDAARASGGALFETTSDHKLREAFVKALDEVKSRYVLGFTPTGVPAGGWHQLDVRVKGRSVTVKARPGYFRTDHRPPGHEAS
jgi:VWFA-related protein